jgi:GTP-binding nuclear protein Ran
MFTKFDDADLRVVGDEKPVNLYKLLQSRMSELRTNVVHAALKVVIVGDGGIGKTSFVRCIQGLSHERKYIATMGVEVSEVAFRTNKGIFKFALFDTAGPEKFGGLRDMYYLHAKAAVVMFDVTSRITYKNIPRWIKDVQRVEPGIPTVVVGSKVDINQRKVKPHQITFPRKKGLPYIEVSSRAVFNVEKVFLTLLQQLYGKDIRLLEEKKNIPDQTDLSIEDMKENERLCYESKHDQDNEEEF